MYFSNFLAIKKLKEVHDKLNEDQRSTEKHMQIFEIQNEIKNCPVLINDTVELYTNYLSY